MKKLPVARWWRSPLAGGVLGLALAAHPGAAADLTVTARESIVRSAPYAVAPLVARVHAGDKLPADDQPQGDWRRVQLPDGRRGFLRDADAKVIAPPVAAPPVASQPPVAPPSAAGSPGGAATPVGMGTSATPELTTPDSISDLTLLGVLFEVMPSGTVSPNATSGVDLDTAGSVAVAPFFDVPLSPYVALGLSPQFIFGVHSKGAAASATEYDLRARLTGRHPMSPNGGVYARLSPAYSIIDLPSGSNPSGFMFDFAIGAEITVLPKLFVVVDLGYQVGLQAATASDGTAGGFSTRFLHVGGGFAIGL